MSKILESIETLKDTNGINENTYLNLMNSMKSDFDKGLFNPNGSSASNTDEDINQIYCRMYLNVVKDCVSTCCTYNMLYNKSSDKFKTITGWNANPPREIFDQLIVQERITLLFPTGICRNNNIVCIDEMVSVVKLKQLAKECKLKKYSQLKRHNLIEFLNENLETVKKHFKLI